MSDNYNKLEKVLTEVFQLDKADLDFGIYRIMNQKRQDVEKFLTKELPSQVRTILEQNNNGDTKALEKELEQAIKQLKDLGMDPENSPKVKELQFKIQNGTSIDALEQDVFSHLASFFKRYYQGGDFISLRRYKKDVYAIPYEGEEVKLHWANHDQYYIKTSEYLKNYAFKLSGDKTVKFELKEASTEQNNNKASKYKERRFALYEEEPVTIQGNTLAINFTYELHKKSVKQDKLSEKAISRLSGKIPADFHELFSLTPTESKKKKTLLEKHISNYTARNSFDYFIHKDLGDFLRRELDFYIKNEVLFIDDINTEDEIAFGSQISKIKALKQVAEKVIQFLEQLENFQKKLWLKKKFVYKSNYCITLDRIPEKYYQKILENKNQIEEWKKLFNVTFTKLEDFKKEPFLLLDTKFFSAEFKDKLLTEFDNLDKQTDGLLVNSENFQCLNLLQKKYSDKINFVYADPPYNAKTSEILYRNSFKHSSWISFMKDRIKLAAALKSEEGAVVTAIDENEVINLSKLLNDLFPYWEQDNISIIHNPAGVQGDNFSYSHEYAIYSYPKQKGLIGKTKREETSEEAFRDWGGTSSRSLAKNCFYPIIVKGDKIEGFGEVCDDDFHPSSSNIQVDDKVYVYPIADDGEERKWVFARNSVESILEELRVKNNKGKITISRVKSMTSYKTVWSGNQFYANIYGSKLLNNILGSKEFDFPKSVYTVAECGYAIESFRKKNSITIDYFAGSGTTGHAVIKQNRKDQGERKYILIEMGEYFNSATKPRIQKVIYSDNWKNGKPKDSKGISQMFKYMSLESYEDALNNLILQKNKTQQDLLSGNEHLKEGYLLQYMLEVESRGHLFNLDAFKNPFNYQLKITENNELTSTTVDLVETFNYLIGLHVKRIQRIGAYKTVEGTTNKGEKVLVIWRNLEETDNEDLGRFVKKADINILDGEFDTIYVNGDNNLANFRKDEDTWKVLLTEETFFTEMFDVKDI